MNPQVPSSNITVYGALWCPDCRRAKQFLGEHQIPYHWVDIEQDKEAEAVVMALNAGKRIIPTIVFEDGSILVEPSNAELASKLGLKTQASMRFYDLVVAGGGPAGLTAALYAAREGMSTLVVERAAFGGQAAATQLLDNMPGFPQGVSGGEFSQRLYEQADRFGVELLQAQDVQGIRQIGHMRCVGNADGDEYGGNALLIATGSRYKRLGVPGEEDYIGAGVHFCATCDGPFYRGKPVLVIGGGNSAAEESLFLAEYVDKVTILVRGNELKASQIIQDKVFAHPKIELKFNWEVEAFRGKSAKLTEVAARNNLTGQQDILTPSGVFVFIGLKPNTAFLQGSGVVTDPWGFIVTGHDLVHDGRRLPGFQGREPMFLETSVPGVFAAGDVRAGSTKQVASATGEGAAAALQIRAYLKRV